MASRNIPDIDPDRYLFPTESVDLIRQGYDVRFASAFQRIQQEDFTGPAPYEDGSLLTLVFILPDTGNVTSLFDQTDKATRKAINKIRKDCNVYMDFYDHKVNIYGRQSSHLAAGAKALRGFIAVNSRGPGCKMYPLVHRSPTVSDPFVFLQPTGQLGYVQFPNGWRGVAMPRNTHDTFELKRNSDARSPLSSKDFMRAFKVLGQSIRPVPGQLRMRIHFGILYTESVKRGIDCFTDTAGFTSFLNQVAQRATLKMHHRLGGPDLTLRMREQIYATETALDATEQKFTSSSATTIYLRDVKPTYCLCLFSKNRRIELDVQYDPDPTLPNLRPTAAAPRIYEAHIKFPAAQIAVACPDQKFDWHLVVEGDIAAEESNTQEVHDLIAVAKLFDFGQPSQNTVEFPAFSVPFAAIDRAKIDRVACKVTWTFEYIQRPLFVEMSVYHDWAQDIKSNRGGSLHLDTSREPRPIKSCGISLFGQEWDMKMHSIDPASSTFDQDFLSLLSDDGESVSAEGLLEEIGYLLDMLSQQARRE